MDLERVISLCVGVLAGLLSIALAGEAWLRLYCLHDPHRGLFFMFLSAIFLAVCVSFLRDNEPRATPGGFDIVVPPPMTPTTSERDHKRHT